MPFKPHYRRTSSLRFAAFTLLSISLFLCSCEKAPSVIARAGDSMISADEFRERFELNPRLLQFKDREEAKVRFLGSLLAEKLLSFAAEEQSLSLPVRSQAFLEQIQREAVIEEFYNVEIAAKIEVTEAELREAYGWQRRELQVQYASFKTRLEAQQFRERVLAGQSFRAALAPVGVNEHHSSVPQVDTMVVKGGVAAPAIEDALFALQNGEVSAPVSALGEFYVASLISEKIDAFPTEDDFQQKREALRRIVQQRKRSAAFAQAFKKMMVGKRTSIPPERFRFLLEKLEEIFFNHAHAARTPNPSPMSNQEFVRAQEGLTAHLNEVFVTFDDGSTWTIKDFLQRLSVGRHNLDFSQRENFRSGMRQALLAMAEQEYIYKEAARHGLDRSPQVTAAVTMWRDNLTARHFLRRLLLPESEITDEQEALALTEAQYRRLAETLLALENSTHIEIDSHALRTLKVANAGLLALKTHFPGRFVVPLPLPLENLSVWQELVGTRLASGTKDP